MIVFYQPATFEHSLKVRLGWNSSHHSDLESSNSSSVGKKTTEVNFLNTQLGFEPHTFHPVWYKYGQTINRNFLDNIYQEIHNGDYKIILVQAMPKEYSGSVMRNEMIDFLLQNKKFKKVQKIYKSPMCLIGERSITDCGIHVFTKKFNDEL